MKRIFMLSVSVLMAVSMMAIGNNSGSTKANAIDFDWEMGNVHAGGTKWYRVDLSPLYEEDNPTLNLYLTNPSRDKSVDVNMKASVAGETENRSYTIAPHQNKSWSANASMLVRLKQKEVYLTLTSDGEILLSAKVFDATDLDETCKDAKAISWASPVKQTPGYAAWWMIDLKPIKSAANKDARLCIKNLGTADLKLVLGQSFDCPSSGLTKRTLTVKAGETLYDTMPRSMVANMASDELYLSIENNQLLQFQMELIDRPATPIIQGTYTDLHVTDAFAITPGEHVYRISVAEMDSAKKYEPEFTYRNNGATPANLNIKMAFEFPAYSVQTTSTLVADGDEYVEVYKKNMLANLVGVEYIYLLVSTDQTLDFTGRFKHVREGKACKTNIDFDWANGHRQDARTTQWYAIDVTNAKKDVKDLVVYIQNEGAGTATINASMAFSCPYIDVQEISRSLTVGTTISRKISYSTYAMMSDTVWIGLETNQQVRLWAETVAAETKTADDKCLTAIDFNWEDGAKQNALDTVWYKIGMNEVRTMQHFPTVYVQNLSTTAPVTIYGELSVECPDNIANEKRDLTIPAGEAYSKKISRDLFKNITQDTIYLRVVATQDVKFEIRLTEEAEGSSCNSAIRFNWVSGNDQAANANSWYAIDLVEAMQSNKDIEITIVNKDNAKCDGSAWLAYTCPFESQQEVNFTLGAKATKSKVLPHSSLETLNDSVLYVRLIGNTALHVEAKLVDPAPFTAIECPNTLKPLDWNTLYTQSTTSEWYVLTGDVLKSLETLTTTPQVYVHNLSGAKNTIKAEVAYHCPITATMISKTITLSNGQELTKMIERSTIEQVIKKDSVLIRVTADAEFEFKAELVNPYTGNDRLHAVRVAFSEAYEQEANTSMWYKINTAELKADPSLHGKSLHVSTKNKGGDATIKVEVYEDVSTVDLLEGRAKRTIAAGQSAAHNIPAYAIYGVADKEVYVKVTTNQPLTISSSLSDYAPAPVDPAQAKAKLAVPNVDYTIEPGTSWFVMCVPYIRNNYVLTDATNVVFSNPNSANATITVTATWQDQCTFDIPERTRTIGGGKAITKTYKELIDMAIKKAGYNYSVEGTDSEYIDSLLREGLTSDSISAYVRITTDQPLNVRINTPQVTGDACANAMTFDWEHGNVNPAGNTTWYQVALDSTKVPVGKDLRLHVENWADNNTIAKAGLYFDCDSAALKSIDYTLDPTKDMWKDIDRDFLVNLGWADMLINYNSDNTTRIWVEVIDEKPRDSVVVKHVDYICKNETEYQDPYTYVNHTINAQNPATLQWTDTIEFLNDTAVAMWDSIIHVSLIVRVDPKLPEISSVVPTIQRGQPIGITAVEAWLNSQMDNADNVNAVDTILWEYWPCGASGYVALDKKPLATEAVAIRYKFMTECGDILVSKEWRHHAVGYDKKDTCYMYDWDGTIYYKSGTYQQTYGLCDNGCDSIAHLTLTIKTDPAYVKLTSLTGAPVVKRGQPIDVSQWDTQIKDSLDKIVKAADTTTVAYEKIAWEWSVDGINWNPLTNTTITNTEAVSIRYSIITECDTVGPDIPIVTTTARDTLTVEACNFYTWSTNDSTYNVSTIDSVVLVSATNLACDSVSYLKLTVNNPIYEDLEAVSKYGNRLLMVNLNSINATTSWNLDPVTGAQYVKWYQVADPQDEQVGEGYYLTQDGEPLVGTFYAVIEIPGDPCGHLGITNSIVCEAQAGAPMLAPSMVKPEETITIYNLNPAKQTTIRVYTTEGLVVRSYNISGQNNFQIKANADHGFYLVEVVSDDIKSTLRYIVK